MSAPILWTVALTGEGKGTVPGGRFDAHSAIGAARQWRRLMDPYVDFDVVVVVEVTADGQPPAMVELRDELDWTAFAVTP